MKANELKIGNFIYYGANERVLDTLLFLQLLKYTTIFEPIPLTEEWLLKLGWVKKENVFRMSKYWVEFRNSKKHGVLIYFGCFNFKYRIYFLEIFNELKYVHQLQNLYFALTGEELTIKEAAQ
jgi:hypothetical protein